MTVGQKPWRRADVVALWIGLTLYTLLSIARRTLLSANATAAIWPAAGLLAVTFLLAPRRAWRWVLAVAVVDNVATNLVFGFSPRTLAGIPEGIMIALLTRVSCPPSLNLADGRTLLRFMIGAVLPACLVSATAVYFIPVQGDARSFAVAERWFIGHTIGAAIVVPSMATLLRPRRFRVFDRPVWELVLMGLGVAAYVMEVLHGRDPFMALMLFPVAMIVAFRYGPVGASLASALMLCLAIAHLYAGIPGPRPTSIAQVTFAQMFVAVVFLTSFPAAGALAQLRRTRRLLARRTEIARLARRKADEAAVSKTRFLANMSHEIRTPLNGVIGLADALSRTGLEPPQREMVDMIQGSGRALNGILSDVLDLARADAGGLRLSLEPFDAGDAVSAASYLFETIAEKKQVGFEVDFDMAYAGPVVGDALRIRQIISNLISNAVKFTNVGEVRVAVRLAPHPLDRSLAELVVSVIDTGPGFDDEVKARLFRRFEQADNSVARRYGGTGLGLAISRELAEMMGGSIDCEAEPGRGATFTFRVMLEVASEQLAPLDTPVDARPRELELSAPSRRQQVLLAEDHPVNQRVVQAILGDRVDLVIVENGEAAVETWRHCAFDLVLMDTQMPVMDGLTAIRTIRSLEARRGTSRTPIVSLTADAMPHQVQDALAAGADRHLAKPVTAAGLIECLTEMLEAKAA